MGRNDNKHVLYPRSSTLIDGGQAREHWKGCSSQLVKDGCATSMVVTDKGGPLSFEHGKCFQFSIRPACAQNWTLLVMLLLN